MFTVALLAGAIGFTTAAPAHAHDGLISSTPTDGEVVTKLSEIRLTFSDELLALAGTTDAFAIRVSDTEGRYFESGCVQLNTTEVTTDVALGPAGAYTVLWQVVSSDGHTTSGEIPFEYRPAEGTPAAVGTATPNVCAANAATSTTVPRITDDTGLSNAEQETILRTVGITAVVFAVVGVGVVILLARRVDRKKSAAAEEQNRLALNDLNTKHGHGPQ